MQDEGKICGGLWIRHWGIVQKMGGLRTRQFFCGKNKKFVHVGRKLEHVSGVVFIRYGVRDRVVVFSIKIERLKKNKKFCSYYK